MREWKVGDKVIVTKNAMGATAKGIIKAIFATDVLLDVNDNEQLYYIDKEDILERWE